MSELEACAVAIEAWRGKCVALEAKVPELEAEIKEKDLIIWRQKRRIDRLMKKITMMTGC